MGDIQRLQTPECKLYPRQEDHFLHRQEPVSHGVDVCLIGAFAVITAAHAGRFHSTKWKEKDVTKKNVYVNPNKQITIHKIKNSNRSQIESTIVSLRLSVTQVIHMYFLFYFMPIDPFESHSLGEQMGELL